MLMVVTLPGLQQDEARYINALFEAGLERLHLRKPDLPEAALHTLMDAVDERHYHRIAWHQSHHLAIRYASKRLHFPEWMRLRHRPEVWQLLQAEQCTLSTSIHKPALLPDCFSYAFAGPVFDSISKPGYNAATDVDAMLKHATRVALGGITAANCNQLQVAGIQNIAVCGAVWQNTDPVAAFLQIQHAWHTTGRSH